MTSAPEISKARKSKKSYTDAWLALLPEFQLPNQAAHSVAQRCAYYADWQTGRDVRPGVKVLARDLRCSERTIKATLAALVEFGVLVQQRVGGRVKGGKAKASQYALSVPAHLATADVLATFPNPRQVIIGRADQGAAGFPLLTSTRGDTQIDQGAAGRTVQGAAGRTVLGAASFTPPSIDPPGDPSEDQHPAAPLRADGGNSTFGDLNTGEPLAPEEQAKRVADAKALLDKSRTQIGDYRCAAYQHHNAGSGPCQRDGCTSRTFKSA